jgi:hypothetical protein
MQTHLGQYTMLLPRPSYREMWEETAAGLGQDGLSAVFVQWEAHGERPHWWNERWKDEWPFPTDAGTKRRASTELEQHEAQSRSPGQLPRGWRNLGLLQEQRENKGEMLTVLSQFSAWEMSPTGMLPTHSHNKNSGSKQKGRGKASEL